MCNHVRSSLTQMVTILNIEKRTVFMNLLVAMSGQLPCLGSRVKEAAKKPFTPASRFL